MPERLKRQSANTTDAATDAATPAVNLTAILNNEGTQVNMPDDTSPILAPLPPTAVELAQAAISQIEAALAILPPANSARVALTEALAEAQGTLALAEAEAALQADKASEIASATAAGAALAPHLLAAMLAAIETKYAPAPVQAPEAEAQVIALPVPNGRRQPSPNTVARNAAAVTILQSDSAAATRCAATVAAFDSDWASDLISVGRMANTRFTSIVAFAGAGVASESDYKALVPQLRAYMLSIGIPAGTAGASDASVPWLLGIGAHAPNGPKGTDALPLKFKGGAAIAQFSDGRFRLARAGTPNVRFLVADGAAYAAFKGSSAAAAPAATVAPAASVTPAVPTPPTTVALPNGSLARTSRCLHCSARNIVGEAQCSACGASDWQVA